MEVHYVNSESELQEAVAAWYDENAPYDDSVSKMYEDRGTYQGLPAAFMVERRGNHYENIAVFVLNSKSST